MSFQRFIRFILQTTPPWVECSILVTLCTIERKPGTPTICSSRQGGYSSIKQDQCSPCSRTSLTNSSQGMIHLSAVRVLPYPDTGISDAPSTVFHGSELSLLFGPVPNSVEDAFANQLTDFYLNFVNDLSPGCTPHRIFVSYYSDPKSQPSGPSSTRRIHVFCNS